MADTLKEAELLLEIQRKAQQISEAEAKLQAAKAAGLQDVIDKEQLRLDFLRQQEVQHNNNLILEQSTIKIREQTLQNTIDEATALQQKANASSDILEKKQLELQAQKLVQKQLEQQLEIEKNSLQVDQAAIQSILFNIEQNKHEIAQKEEELAVEQKISQELKKQQEERKKLSEELVGYFKNMTGGLLETISQMSDLKGITTAFGERLKEAVFANQQFAASTGQMADSFGGMFTNTTGLEAYGIRSIEFQKNFSDLYTSMAGFNSLSLENQKILTDNASKMTNLKFSVEESAMMYNIFQKSLGMGVAEMISTQNELTKLALAAGIAPSKMLKDFAAAMPQLAAYGKQSVQVFKELQLQAKSLGVEMSTLTSIFGESFDTFEGAADKAGKLNSILGGDYLNSVELQNAKEHERVELIKMAIEASGKNFDSMDKFQRKSIAATLGIKDVNEANKIFGNTSAEMRAKMALQAVEQERLDKIQKESADIIKQLKGAFDQLLIAVKPVVGLFKEFVMFLVENPWIGQLVAFIGLMAVLTKALAFLASPFTALINIFKIAGPAGGAAGARMAGGIARIGRAAGIASKGLLTLGAVFLMIGAGIGIAAAGLGYLVSAFQGLQKEQLDVVKSVLFGVAIGIGLLTVALIVLAASAPATLPAVGILKLFGLAILLIGAGIGIAAGGMALFVNSLGSLSANAAGLTSVLTSLGTIAALGTLGSLALIGGTKVIVKAIEMLSEALDKLPEEKSIKVTSTMNSINSLLTTAKALKSEELKPATEFVTAVKQYYEVQATSKDAKDDALFNSLQKLLTPAKGATEKTSAQQPKNITVILKVDSQTIMKKMLDVSIDEVVA